jgi:hypothetical protein
VIVGGHLSRFLPAALLAAVLGVLGTSMPVPLVALGPGPTYDTLGDVDGAPVVTVDGLPTFPTSGHLNMTTVAVSDGLTFVQMLRAWGSDGRQVVPRSQIFPPGKTDDQVREENTQQFATSESNAELAAMTQLAIPTRVVVGAVVPDSPAASALRVVGAAGRHTGLCRRGARRHRSGPERDRDVPARRAGADGERRVGGEPGPGPGPARRATGGGTAGRRHPDQPR